MQTKTFNQINETYELEIERILKNIKKEKAKKVLLQFPDGLKPWATAISEELKKQADEKIDFFISMDTCFGACDIPVEAERLGVDMIVQFGHSDWNFEEKQKKVKILK